MPRDGSYVYYQPFDEVDPDTTIESAVYNGFTRDVEHDLNQPRPIIAGGTGATSIDGALQNLNAEKAAQLVTNFDTHLWLPGSFRHVANVADVGQPVLDHDFAGVCYINEALTASGSPPTNLNIIVEARDLDDEEEIIVDEDPEMVPVIPGRVYVREKRDGVWSDWTEPGAGYVLKDGDTMTGPLILSEHPDDDSPALQAATKQYADNAVQIARRVNVLAPHEGLIVKNTSATLISLVAEAVVLFDAAGSPKRFATLNHSINIAATVGANALDTGTKTVSTWYHIWAIGKEDGTSAGLLSLSRTAPTMPTDYVYKGYVGAVYNIPANTFQNFTQRGRYVAVSPHISSLTGANATPWTPLSLLSVLPATATIVVMMGHVTATSGTNIVYFSVASNGSAPIIGTAQISAVVEANGMQAHMRCLLETEGTVYYQTSGTNRSVNMTVRGWEY